jgi:serine/threonine protein kinase/tetratricopeptide (TPR) repeat protein
VREPALIGQTLSHYRIEKRLGAGGMGEVFLARDLALGRMAAVKVLSTALTPETRARMLREAEAAARLQHPAIATFFEAGESDGVAFLAMEFVEGETLRDRLRRGPLPFPQALSIAGALLEALGHAHTAGVLHRDIKPENVMVTADNLARLLDFGIARLQGANGGASEESATEVALTQPGAVIGTLGYMSPEQLRGQPLDERSDLFSLGAVLFEMLEGRPAFPGATPTERIAAILGSEPRLSGDHPGVPGEAASVLARALARDPEGRYPSAAAFLSDLRALASGELVASLPDSLAIVDLRNLSRVADDDWIGSGFAESLASDLARLGGVSLVPRQKVLQARSGGPGSESELGRKLGCRWVLSGAYQRMGRRLRVTALLSDSTTGQTVFSEKLDGDLDEIFALQDRLSALVAGHLGAGGAPEARPAPRIDVYELHARGRRFFHRLEKGTLDQARELFELAAGADPSYAPALAGLAAVHAMRYPFQTDPKELETSESYARRAIAADPDLAEPRIWLGYSLTRLGRQEEALSQEVRAMELDPTSAFAPYFAAFCAAQMGQREQALPLFQRAVELDPRHGFAWLALGWTHADLGHGAEAQWCLEKAVSLENQTASGPTAGAAGYLGEYLRRAGELEKARVACLAGLDAVERSDNMYRDTFRGVCLCALGRTALAQGDVTAARAAFVQAAAHLRGRPRTLGGGQLLVQALAGLARAGDGEAPLNEALELFESRRSHNFDLMWACSDDVTLFELARGAGRVGRTEQSAGLFARARESGSREALDAGAP